MHLSFNCVPLLVQFKNISNWPTMHLQIALTCYTTKILFQKENKIYTLKRSTEELMLSRSLLTATPVEILSIVDLVLFISKALSRRSSIRSQIHLSQSRITGKLFKIHNLSKIFCTMKFHIFHLQANFLFFIYLYLVHFTCLKLYKDWLNFTVLSHVPY